MAITNVYIYIYTHVYIYIYICIMVEPFSRKQNIRIKVHLLICLLWEGNRQTNKAGPYWQQM